MEHGAKVDTGPASVDTVYSYCRHPCHHFSSERGAAPMALKRSAAQAKSEMRSLPMGAGVSDAMEPAPAIAVPGMPQWGGAARSEEEVLNFAACSCMLRA